MSGIMFLYGAIMLLGIWAGMKFSWIPSESKTRERLQYVFLFTLLFVLGHQLGSDETVVASMSQMGLYGLAIGAASMLGSFAFVIVLRLALERRRKAGRDD